MTINRFNSADNFVMMSKQGLKDERLSWKAKGILAYMMSLPADWQTHLSEVARHSTDGIDSLRGGFKELEEYGYVRRYQGEKEKGKFAKWITDVSDVPIYKKISVEEPNKVETYVEKPDVEIPYADNPTLLSNNNTNNKITNNNNTISSSKNEEEEVNMQKLFDYWNSKKITVHKELKPIMRKSIKARLKNYTYKQISEAINNYEKVYRSDQHFFDTKYTFVDILREKDVQQFMNESEPLIKFLRKKNSYNKPTQQQVVSQPAAQKIFDPSQLFAD